MSTRRKDVALPGNGGQYAPFQAPESDITDLVAPVVDITDLWGTPSVEPLPPVQPATDTTTPTEPATSGSVIDWEDPAAVRELMKVSRRVSRSWGAKRGAFDNGMDVDDLAQEAVIAVLAMRANGNEDKIRDLYGLVNKSAANIASRAGRHVRSEDMKAYREFRTRLAELTAIAGRDLTTREKDDLAQHIRDNWPDRNHRPSRDFRNNVQGWEKVRSENMTEEVFDQSVAMHGSVHALNYVKPDSHLDVALSYIDGDGGTKRSALRHVWNAVAERAPGSPIIEPHLGHRAVARAHAAIQGPEDLRSALEAWGNGDDTPETEAVMAPWSNLDLRDQASAVNVLEAYPDYAYKLWAAAVAAAARPRGVQKSA